MWNKIAVRREDTNCFSFPQEFFGQKGRRFADFRHLSAPVPGVSAVQETAEVTLTRRVKSDGQITSVHNRV